MSSYAKQIEIEIKHEPENKLLEAGMLYRQSFSTVPETAYYKALERLCRQGTLIHLTKGIYYRPKQSRFGVVPISEKEIISHYTGNSRGVVIGYTLFNRKGLTTQLGKNTDILSSVAAEQKKSIKNVNITYCGIAYTEETVPVIETMEILQNYKYIEDINRQALADYMKNFASVYSDAVTVSVLKSRKYKKSTIALLERFLSYFGIKNSLGQFLSTLSKYDIPEMEEFYESARA